MLKKLLFAIVLFSYTIQAQTYVKGTLSPYQKYSWVVLYQLKGSKLLYIKNATIKNGEFSIEFPQNSSKGMYRLLYDQQKNGHIDFLYNKETVVLEFNPEDPIGTVNFLTSEENKIYHKYIVESAVWKQKLDSLQLAFFNAKNGNDRNITSNLFKIARANFNKFQTQYESTTRGKLAYHFIKSSNKYYSPKIIETPQVYLNNEKQHYFDFINFEDAVLINSTFLSEKIIDYVFYLNSSDDLQVQNALYKSAVQEVMQHLGGNNVVKSELLTLLLFTFTKTENIVLIDFVFENFYKKLPKAYKNETIIKKISEKVKLAVGKTAPEITWKENGITKKLSELKIAEKYIVVFWSTGCSHCLVEIPQLYELTKDKTNVHVIAFALEENDVAFNQKTLAYKKWTNILGLKKWQNSIARDYQIVVTPSYFILDKNKKIIAKLGYFNDVKAFLGN